MAMTGSNKKKLSISVMGAASNHPISEFLVDVFATINVNRNAIENL